MLTRLNKHITEHSAFYLIFALAIILRITFMVTQGLSHDELSAWNRLFVADFAELMSVGVGGDMHPAFMQIVLWLWVKVAGDGEFAFRIPTLLFGLGGIALIYATGIRFFSKHAALMAAGTLSVFVFPILHTTMARPYSSGFFFAILLVYGILSLRNSERKTQLYLSLLLILAGLTGAMYSHYYAFMCAAWISFVSLFYLKRTQLIPFVVTGLIALGLFYPHLELTNIHLDKGELGWLGKPDSFWLFAFFQEFFNSSKLLFILFVGAVSFAYFANRKQLEKFDYYPFLIFFGMYVAGHAYSLHTPILREPGQLFTLPFLFLGLGHLLSQIEWKKYARILVLSSVFIAVHSVTLGKLTKTVHFEPFREMVELIDRFDNELGEENILRFTNVTGTNYLNYYARNSGTSLDFEMDLIEEIDSIHKLAELVSTTDKPYAMLARTNRQQNVIQYEIFRHYFPEVKYHEDFFNANFSVWKRGDFKNRKFVKEINSSNTPTLFENWALDTNANEFYGGVKIKVDELMIEGTYVLIRTQGWISDEVGTLGFVTVLERDGEMLMNNNEDPVLYESWDQCVLIPEKGQRTFFTAIKIPKQAKNSDEIHIYFWNPEKKSVTFSKPSIYVVQATN